MTNYRRVRVPGATWFFTVALAQRQGNDLLIHKVDALRSAFRQVQQRHPFHLDAVVVLPEHLHCIWTLPDGDADISSRWGLIKAAFSRSLTRAEHRSTSRRKRGERGVWQRRFWEHLIRDDEDFRGHADYIHWNPVKHGYVSRPAEWPYSSFGRFVARGLYPVDWGVGEAPKLPGGIGRE